MAYLTYWLKSHWTPPLFQDIKVLLMYCFRTTLLYPKSINYLLLALKSISDIMPLLSLCRKGREIVCWAFVLRWIFGLRAKPLHLKLPTTIPPHYKVVAGSKWAAFFVIGPLLRMIAIEHPRWGIFIFVIIVLLSWLKDGEEPLS